MFITVLVTIAVAATIIYFAAKRNENDLANDSDSPLEIIEKRYARGEIDRAELARRRSILKGEAE